MRRVVAVVLVALFVFVTTLVVVRFVPGAGQLFGPTQYDTYADGRCEVTENAVVRLSYALLGRPGPKDTMLEVVVSDSRGPIAGARVHARAAQKEARSSPATTTDATGRARLKFTEDTRVKNAVLDVDATGFSLVHREVVVDGSVIAVKLISKIPLTGVVLDEDQKPVRASILGNGCGPIVETSDTGGFELSCEANFRVWVSARRGEREEDAWRIDGVGVAPPINAKVVTLKARRRGAKAVFTLPNGASPGSDVMLTQQDGKDAELVYAAWQKGERFGFIALEPGHWWVYFRRVDEPNVLRRSEFTTTEEAVTELVLPRDAPVVAFPE